MNAIILCGGLSTRLGDITKDVPKILLKIGDRTVLDWQLEKIKTLGVKQVVLAAGHLANVLHEEIGNERNGLELIYAIEDKRLGTGGAIKHALQYVLEPDKPTIIYNGDVLTTVNFEEMYSLIREGSDGIILGAKVKNASNLGTLVYDEKFHLSEFKEKEGLDVEAYINGGVYMFNPQILKYFPDKDSFSIEREVFPLVKDLYVYESDRPWVDIGVPKRLEWARDNWEVFRTE